MEVKTSHDIELDKYENAVIAGNDGLHWDTDKKNAYAQKKWISVESILERLSLDSAKREFYPALWLKWFRDELEKNREDERNAQK